MEQPQTLALACLQFAPQCGNMDYNFECADKILEENAAKLKGLDLLVLPELAFSGRLVSDASRTIFHETLLWAKMRAQKFCCAIAVGYAEVESVTFESYNSVMIVDKKGELIANSHKSTLCYPNDAKPKNWIQWEENLGMQSRMENKDFLRREPAWERSAIKSMLQTQKLIILPLACTDKNILEYWISILEAGTQWHDNAIAIIANQCGVDGDIAYAGGSGIFEIWGGKVQGHACLGQGEGLLAADILFNTTLSAGQEIERPRCPEPGTAGFKSRPDLAAHDFG